MDPSDQAYHEARAFWYGLINYEQRTPSPADLKLDQMRALVARLGDPQRRLRILHVAGSKGKGSTAAMLSAVLRGARHRTGLFTSPHLCRVEERFQVDGAPITRAELTALLNDVRRAVSVSRAPEGSAGLHPALPSGARLNDVIHSPTFFEVATAVGFLHF